MLPFIWQLFSRASDIFAARILFCQSLGLTKRRAQMPRRACRASISASIFFMRAFLLASAQPYFTITPSMLFSLLIFNLHTAIIFLLQSVPSATQWIFLLWTIFSKKLGTIFPHSNLAPSLLQNCLISGALIQWRRILSLAIPILSLFIARSLSMTGAAKHVPVCFKAKQCHALKINNRKFWIIQPITVAKIFDYYILQG